jgi:cell cycle arrest protein BUB2
MNILLAPFLYITNEIDSFHLLTALIKYNCPKYVDKNLEGVHKAVTLFDKCLQLLDIELYNHIILSLSNSSIFSFGTLLTMFANKKPLEDILILWDAIFAFGIHFTILLFCSYVILKRDDLLNEKNNYE